MQRVKSDDLNADDEDCPKDSKKEEKLTISSPIGAGLPLLQRLRLLKEKQVRFLNAFTYFIHLFVNSQAERFSSVPPNSFYVCPFVVQLFCLCSLEGVKLIY